MKQIVFAIVAVAIAGQVAAATCVEQANEKKMRSHVQEYFMQRCEEEAKKRCEAEAKEKKLTGLELRKFVRQCVVDAVGAK